MKKCVGKSFKIGILMACSCLLLTGCHLKHEWTEATCTEPRTCVNGGETEGEALGHTFVEATCTEPKTCGVCGETEGEALGHTFEEATCDSPKTCSVCGLTEGTPLAHEWTEADFWTAKTCNLCGKTEGDVLPPAFEEHGLKADMELGKTYSYHTNCYEAENEKTVGKLTLSDYKIFESDDTHEAKEGYEWRSVHAHVLFDDDNAYFYGMNMADCYENYYDIIGWDDSVRTEDDIRYYTVIYNGEIFDACRVKRENAKYGEWINETCTWDAWYYAQVPVGYDGCIIGFRDPGNEWGEGKYIFDVADENTLFFRMK